MLVLVLVRLLVLMRVLLSRSLAPVLWMALEGSRRCAGLHGGGLRHVGRQAAGRQPLRLTRHRARSGAGAGAGGAGGVFRRPWTKRTLGGRGAVRRRRSGRKSWAPCTPVLPLQRHVLRGRVATAQVQHTRQRRPPR